MPDLRSQVDTLIASGDADGAQLRLAELWRAESTSATAAFVVARLEKLRGKLNLRPYKLAILRSFTVEPVVSLLRAAAFGYGLDLTVHVGDFNVYAQEILDKDSALYKFAPDAVILAVRTAELAPDLWQNYADLAPEQVTEAAQRVSTSLTQWIRAFRERSHAALMVHNLEQPARPSTGLLDAQSNSGQGAAIRSINDSLRQAASEQRGVYVLDYDALVARFGRLGWRDERKWLTRGCRWPPNIFRTFRRSGCASWFR